MFKRERGSLLRRNTYVFGIFISQMDKNVMQHC